MSKLIELINKKRVIIISGRNSELLSKILFHSKKLAGPKMDINLIPVPGEQRGNIFLQDSLIKDLEWKMLSNALYDIIKDTNQRFFLVYKPPKILGRLDAWYLTSRENQRWIEERSARDLTDLYINANEIKNDRLHLEVGNAKGEMIMKKWVNLNASPAYLNYLQINKLNNHATNI